MTDAVTGRRLLTLVDLTSLNDDDDEAVIDRLCERAIGDFGSVAAVCVWPRFVPLCRRRLEDTGVRIAAVANFPDGSGDIHRVKTETADAVAAGADEVDLVFPYRAWLNGDEDAARAVMRAGREVCDGAALKIILETGALASPGNIAAASLAAIEAGANFIKTSTGKTAVSATLPAATVMLCAIKQSGKSVGFKAAGGIRTTAQAIEYLHLADGVMGSGWVSPATFRIGASSLLDDLLAVITGSPSAPSGGSY
jgi:deoxyribose-phosphate aldolase